MSIEYFKITGYAVTQIFLLALLGYLLVKRNFFSPQGLDNLSRFVLDVTLPLLIFCQLVADFRFDLYPDWWIFPLLSFAVTFAGLIAGFIFLGIVRDAQKKAQFLSLVTFQNSGYLPLALIGALLPPEKMSVMFIYLFLFMAGFNFAMFSLGVYLLAYHKEKKFEWKNFLNMPVIATVAGLLVVFFNLGGFIPQILFNPMRTIGICTLPLAMLVVGGNLAEISLRKVDKKETYIMCLLKMFLLPALGLAADAIFKMRDLVALLIIIQLAMPPATTLSIIIRKYKREDLLISQGIFYGHLVGIVSIPLFLSLYFMFNMVK